MLDIVAVAAASSAFCFVCYLVFLAYVIRTTGTTASLRDVALAIRAFKFPFRSDKEAALPGAGSPDTTVSGEPESQPERQAGEGRTEEWSLGESNP